MDDRFDKLARELRASRPVAPERLRNRVEALARVEPKPRREWSFRLPPRRVALGLVALALLGSLVAAGVTGLDRSSAPQQFGAVEKKSLGPAAGGAAGVPAPNALSSPYKSERTRRADLAPAGQRLQQYDAALRLRVKDVDALSDATKRAMTLTRALGGYVASVSYSTVGGRRGGATLVLRVPIVKVQAVLDGLTGLGTILRQQTAILDVTRRSDRELRQIAKLEQQLATAGPEEAAAIRLRLKTLRAKHARLVRSARFARISLGLTTPARQAASSPSRFDRTIDDAGAVLLRELEILLYALVVAGPLLAIGGAAVVLGRAQRRRSDRRLLERT